MSNKEISKQMNASKIFLSFSNFEGLGLPPIEAAFAGNKIIGYTGEGGNDYFKQPLFEKVSKGNILEFSKKIENNIKNFKKKWHSQKKILKKRKDLISKYSSFNEEKNIKNILNYIIFLYRRSI